MKFYKYLLNEKTYDIDRDVDWLYNQGFKQLISYINKNNIKDAKKITDNEPWLIIKSDKLKDEECVLANDKNPVNIIFNINSGNYYIPSKQEIGLALNNSAYNLLVSMGWDFIFDQIGSQYKRFKSEFTESSIKGSIYHELSHWINDTLHNKNISKELYKRKEHDYGNINLHHIELDAQVHAIKQLKRSLSDWEEIGWFDIIEKKPSFHHIFSVATSNKSLYKDYMKRLTKRLVREDLFNKKLSNFPDYNEMKNYLKTH